MSEFEQGTQEWLDSRMKIIGGSDAPIILGISPYSTPYKLWRIKKGLDFVKETPPMRWGKENEEPARKRYNEITGYAVASTVVTHPNHCWMRASLDGLSCDFKYACEIKSNGEKIHSQVIEGNIPEHHIVQMQFQMECSGSLTCMDYVSDYGGSAEIITIEKEEGWMDKHIETFKEFYSLMKGDTPPPMTEKDTIDREDPAWRDRMEEYLHIDDLIKQLESEKEMIKLQLIDLSPDFSTKGGGGTLTKYTRPGNIDYGKIEILKSLDLDEYRKPTSDCWRVTKNKD